MAGMIKVVDQAGCRHAPHTLMVSTRFADLVRARSFCSGCPIQQQCYSLIDPEHSYFDGTAGGRSWRDGHDISHNVNALLPYREYFTFNPDRTRVRLVAEAARGRYPIVWLKKDERMLLAFVAKSHGVDERKIAKWLGIPVAAVTVLCIAVDDVITPSLRRRVLTILFTGRNVKRMPPPSWTDQRKKISDAVLLKPGVELPRVSHELIDQGAAL